MAPKSFKGFKAALERNSNRAQIVERDQQARMAEQTIICGSDTITTTLGLPPSPQPLLFQLPLAHTDDGAEDKDEIYEQHPPRIKTQTSQTLDDFQKRFSVLLLLLLDKEASRLVGEPCRCGASDAQKTTRCYDCQLYEISCTDCFIQSHAHLPTHWAEVWDPAQGFFIRHDIATLKPDISSINFGHAGQPCMSKYATNVIFHIIDTNGIHQTKVRFCMCEGNPDRVVQLMHSRLFPATVNQPTMAFTFQVLHQFHLHHLESKESTHDFIGALRRLTDNAFPQRVPDPSSQFRVVMRIWRLLTAEKRLGQAHGIDSLLTQRREGSLIVPCPACPDPDINLEPGWERTPENLRHLQQTQLTADGNFHSNKYRKNTDPDDISLYAGRAYFPEDTEYREYIKNLPQNAPEKIGPCDHLNALNKQDRKKFKNMDITGVVSIQCSHIFIKSTVDLQLGEKFANTDYALAHAVRHNKRSGVPPSQNSLLFLERTSRVLSYDVSCGYGIHAISRFELNFPTEAAYVQSLRWLIPLVHINNHNDECTYLFSSAYTEGVGHFHGETAEMPWVELNQLAPQTRQMNNGHRQDTIIDHHSHWNWAKTSNMAATLYNEVQLAQKLFLEKHAAFKTLCALYADKVSSWDKMDRKPKVAKDGTVESVYRQNDDKAPSQSRIYQSLLAHFKSSSAPMLQLTIPSFLNEGLLIAAEQHEIVADIKAQNDSTSIENRRDRLRRRIDKWHKLQKDLMPNVGDIIAQQAISGKFADVPEKEVLYLPSDFSEGNRMKYDLVMLGEHERHFREGAAYDAIAKVRIFCKTVDAMWAWKKVRDRGQKNHTRSTEEIHILESICNRRMDDYSASRYAMISLGLSPDSPSFPPLSLEDTFRKPTNIKRAVGDSRRTDGPIWTRIGSAGGLRRRRSPITKNKVKGKKRRTEADQSPSAMPGMPGHNEVSKSRPDGWIWSFRPVAQMSNQEVQKWMDDSDRVQWFRAEAEMQRWREEWESKLADFRRCIAYFHTMSSVWMRLSNVSTTPGSVAYAQRQSAMFKQMENDAKELFCRAGYARLINLEKGKILADYIQEERSKSDYFIPELSDISESSLHPAASAFLSDVSLSSDED